MRSGIIAKKMGMTRIFNDNGQQIPVTVLRLEKLQVVAQKTVDKDGYFAVKLGAGSVKAKNCNKSLRGQFSISKVEPKRKLKEFIRVDHAGERGAVKIYEGQLLALNTVVKDDNLKKIIEEMKVHEKEHCEFFEEEIKKRNIQPTKLLPLWYLLGIGLGFGSTIIGKKAAMLCTASVEEVIDKHYLDQINQLGTDEAELKKKIKKFRDDELHHKDIAYEKGATKKGLYSLMDKIIKTGSKIAINISEKI